MIQTKQLYLSPTTETLVVQVEEMICFSKNVNSNTEYFGVGGYEEL